MSFDFVAPNSAIGLELGSARIAESMEMDERLEYESISLSFSWFMFDFFSSLIWGSMNQIVLLFASLQGFLKTFM